MTSDLTLLISYLLILVTNFALSTDQHEYNQGGGGGGGVLLITNNKPNKYQSDMLLITGQKGCSPTIIKTGSKRSKNMIVVGQCNNQHKKIKKEIIPVPMPYKEYIPVPFMKEETKPIIINIKKSMPQKMPMQYGNGYGMGMGMGMDSMNVPVADMSMDSLINDMMAMGSKKAVTVVAKNKTDKTDKMDNKKLKIRRRKSSSLFKLKLK